VSQLLVRFVAVVVELAVAVLVFMAAGALIGVPIVRAMQGGEALFGFAQGAGIFMVLMLLAILLAWGNVLITAALSLADDLEKIREAMPGLQQAADIFRQEAVSRQRAAAARRAEVDRRAVARHPLTTDEAAARRSADAGFDAAIAADLAASGPPPKRPLR
jgi:hypothetical protein